MKFKSYRMDELAIIKYGKNQKKVISKDGNIPIFGTGGLIGYANKALYAKPSVLIGRKGTIDRPIFVTEPFWTVDTLFYTIINEDLILPQYLYYLISNTDLKLLNEGTTIPSLRTETLNRLILNIPKLTDQRKIVSLIQPIENKIQSNNKINKNLFEQAQVLFQSWFCNFDPYDGVMPSDWHYGTVSEIIELHGMEDKRR